MEGILLFYKPTGWTNKSIIGFLKRMLRVAKLGHAGTLDPFAEGLMVVAIGRKFTRGLHDLLTASTKEYVATIELGKTSDTFDNTGAITDTGSDTRPSIEDVRHAIETHLLGERAQIPPVYSAKKFSGKRLRDIATKEGARELAASRAKQVTLHGYAVVSYAYPLLTVRLSVSSGYYIRTFGNDLGKLLGTGAYLTALKRTRINGYSADDALSPDDLEHAIEACGLLFGDVQGVGYRYAMKKPCRAIPLHRSCPQSSRRIGFLSGARGPAGCFFILEIRSSGPVCFPRGRSLVHHYKATQTVFRIFRAIKNPRQGGSFIVLKYSDDILYAHDHDQSEQQQQADAIRILLKLFWQRRTFYLFDH